MYSVEWSGLVQTQSREKLNKEAIGGPGWMMSRAASASDLIRFCSGPWPFSVPNMVMVSKTHKGSTAMPSYCRHRLVAWTLGWKWAGVGTLVDALAQPEVLC